MISNNIKSIFELTQIFSTEQDCIDYYEDLRWNGIVVSPFDPTSTVYKCSKNRYRCRNTGKYFNVKTGTMFENTKINFRKWFIAIWLVTSHKKGISSMQLGKDTVVQNGYYIISPRLITDKTPLGCGHFIAYNLFKSATSTAVGIEKAFDVQDVHMAAGPGQYDFIYTSNVAYLTAGTYYMWVRVGNGCTTNTARTNSGQNSFTLTLLK